MAVRDYGSITTEDDSLLQGNFQSTIIECPDEATWVQYSELYDFLLVGFADSGIRVFKDNKCTMQLMDDDLKKERVPVTCMKHRPVSKNYPVTNTLICTYKNGFVKGWNYNFQECAFTLKENRQTNGVFYHPKLAKYVTVGDNKKIYLYDEDSKRQERVLTASDDAASKDGHHGSVMAAVFHPKQLHELISGGNDSTIQFWDTRQPHATRRIEGVFIAGEGIDFCSRGTEFITCNWQKEKPLRLWDYGSGKEIQTMEPDKHKNIPMYCGKYLTKTTFLCAGGPPVLIRLIDMTLIKNVHTVSRLKNLPTNFTIGPHDPNLVVPKYAFGCGNKIFQISLK